MRQRITKCQHHPSPAERIPREILATSAVVSFTLLFFFLWFHPDKVQSLEHGRWLRVTGGLVLLSFAIMSISQYVLLRVFARTFRAMNNQRITLFAVPLLMLGVGIFLYFYLLEFIRLNPIAFLKIQLRTVLIGLSPMLVARRLLARNSGAPMMNGASPGVSLPQQDTVKNAVVSLSSESGRERITVVLDDLLLVTSADNYVVVFSKSNTGFRKELLRTSLSRVERLLRNHPTMFRCHRTAIVNLRKVKSASGNSQGFELELEHLDRTVPVARSRVRSFRNVLIAIQK